MMNTWVLSALCVGLALIATLIALWFRVAGDRRRYGRSTDQVQLV
jgi:hypothetical protein